MIQCGACHGAIRYARHKSAFTRSCLLGGAYRLQPTIDDRAQCAFGNRRLEWDADRTFSRLIRKRDGRCETAMPESIESADRRIASATATVSRLIVPRICEICLVADELRSASLRTSSATTA